MSTVRNIAVLEGHVEDRVWHLSWSHDGCMLASCGEDKVLRIWSNPYSKGDWESSGQIECIATLEEAQSRTLRCCEWSPDSSMLACASFDGTVVVWEVQSPDYRKWDQIASLEGHESEVKSCSWSYDGRLLATCGRDKKIWIWERFDGGEFECISMLDGHSQDVKFVRFHHKMPVLFSTSYDDSIKVWREDGDDWFCAATLSGTHKSTVWGIAIHYNQPRVVSCSGDGSIAMWHNDSPDLNASWRLEQHMAELHKFGVYSIDWSHDHNRIITSGGDNAVRVLQVSNEGVNIETSLSNAHDNDINCVRWNPHSEYATLFATAGDDGLVRIWQLEI